MPSAGRSATPSATSSYSTRRIGEIGQDIERLVPTAGDAFTMTVTGKTFDERKLAGRALMKEILTLVQLQQEGEVVIASIGGFDLEYSGERFGKDGYRYTTMLHAHRRRPRDRASHDRHAARRHRSRSNMLLPVSRTSRRLSSPAR